MEQTTAKRARLVPVSNKSCKLNDIKVSVLYNIDTFNIIISNLSIIEIIFSLLTINVTLYQFIKNNKKSLYTIKRCIDYDIGILSKNKLFPVILSINKNFNNSYLIFLFCRKIV